MRCGNTRADGWCYAVYSGGGGGIAHSPCAMRPVRRLSVPVDVLVIDDDVILRRAVGTMLAGSGITTVSVANGQPALTLLAALSPRVVLLDPARPAPDDGGSVHELRRSAGDVPIVLMSSGATRRQNAAELGAAGCLWKPFGIDELLLAVRPFLSRWSHHPLHCPSRAT